MARKPRFLLVILGACAGMAIAGCNRSESTPNAIGTNGTAATKPAAAGQGGATPGKATGDPQHPVVQMDTSLGTITLRLDAAKAPISVENFLNYVNAGHYDQTIIHQIYKGQGIVGGGYNAKFIEKPTRTPIRNEAANGLKNRRGTIAMVRKPSEIDSSTCQFFINVADNPNLDYRDNTPEGYGYCVFGEVIEGLDVVDKINAVPVRDAGDFERTPSEPVIVKSVRRIR